MEEKAKTSQGASVTKAGTIGGQSSLLKSKAKWDQQSSAAETFPAPTCQDNSFDADPAALVTAPSPRAKKPAEKQDIGEQIGRQLRSVYNDVLAQPVPDRFLDLLRTLEKDAK